MQDGRDDGQDGQEGQQGEPGGSVRKQRDQWTSRIGVILAVAGSAVGLGNFLRFPGQAAENGGGAFMVPYFIAFLLLGIPICWAEWTMGRMGGRMGFHSSPAIYGAVAGRPRWRFMGALGVLIPIIIYMYYVVIESWCLGYALAYLTGSIDLGNDPSTYGERSAAWFGDFVGIGGNGLRDESGISTSVYLWLFVFVVNFAFIYRGISKGIETFCKYAVPLMALCAVIVLVRVLTLGTPNPELPDQNVLNGLGFMWNPKSSAVDGSWVGSLADPGVWLAATGQIFFSLSVGFGIIINYASYLHRDKDVVLSGLTASSTNEFFEVCLGGLITIPAAFIFLGAAGATGGTFGLGFNALPVVFLYMPGGEFFGFLWFFMLFLAAITSSLSMLQPGIAFLEEGLDIDRHSSVMLLGLLTGAGSLFVVYFSEGLAALDTMDFWVGTAGIFVLATLQVILYGWVLGVDKGIEEAERGAQLHLPKVFRFVIKYVSPAYLLTIFVLWSRENLPGYIDSLSKGGVPLVTVGIIFGVLAIFLILVHVASGRWDRETQSSQPT
ncbi:MAG: sodium-dependent transporter [Myxococcota bacterium]|nr:sodium-dependent transporter [Myxococcota bacterium]